jgi:hypothetical protein
MGTARVINRLGCLGLSPKRAEDDDYTAKETEIIQVIIAKQRNGPTDVVNLVYQRKFCAFQDYAQTPTRREFDD